MSIIFLLFLFCCTSLVSCTTDDEITLLKIKQQLGDPNSLSSWAEGYGAMCRSWSIACNNDGVYSLHMYDYLNITGPFPFPDAICDLTNLEYLTLHGIGLSGPIPPCITQLPKLTELSIVGTYLSGSIPSFTYQTNLKQIDLRNNYLSGTIPPSLSSLPNLDYLDLSSNNLTGTIPSGLVHGSSILILSNNSFTGELPRCYGWVDLWNIDVSNNQLSGDASFLFGKQKILGYMNLANNEFEFDLGYTEIPQNLVQFNISHNKIYGKIPNSFSTAAHLENLDLSFNKLCGEIPQRDNEMYGEFYAESFANNTCLCGHPLAPCSTSAPPPGPI